MIVKGHSARLVIAVAVTAAAACLAPPALASSTGGVGPAYAPGEVLVRFGGDSERRVELPRGVGVGAATRALRSNPRVAYAVPNFLVRAAQSEACVPGGPVPNDPGVTNLACGWRYSQWNFLPCGSFCAPDQPPLQFQSAGGIDAPRAWATLAARGRPWGRGVRVAVLDTGVAYRRLRPRFRKSPDFHRSQFMRGFDFVARNRAPVDRDGHGTHIAGTIAERTGNGVAMTGLVPGARILPVRVLNANGVGTAHNVTRGIRYAARRGARIINLSFEFGRAVRNCRQIRGVCRALRFATNRRRALVVAASGNGAGRVAFPARAPRVLAVGASTEGACVATYSNRGRQLDLVAPGGSGERGPDCAARTQDRPIYQLTFRGRGFRRFGFPHRYFGTSMAAAHVSGVAAMVVASGVLGKRRGRGWITCQLKRTARRTGLGQPYHRGRFGAGILNAGEAVRTRAC